jgi:hypothetical protein
MQGAVTPPPACFNGGVVNYTGQLYIISPCYVLLMTAAEVEFSVMRPATARTVLASNLRRGKRISSSSKRPDRLLGPSGHTFNWYRGFFQGGKATGM